MFTTCRAATIASLCSRVLELQRRLRSRDGHDATENNEGHRRNFSTKTTEGLLRALEKLLPDVEYSSNPYELERHGRGESYHPPVQPHLVLYPKEVQTIQSIVRQCVEHRIPIIPFGAGTSVEGHLAALQGGISLNMQHFNDIQIPDYSGDSLPDPLATVGAGVTRKQLNEALRHTGLEFVVDPGADATLGGMTATGASGTTAVQHGTMRENLLALEAVLADATTIQTGTQALKNSAGYDLLSLMCGSEGTLGIITSVTVKLRPIPDAILAAVCVFDDLYAAAAAVSCLKLTQVPLSRCELLDASSVRAFNAYNPDAQAMADKPTLFLEFQGTSHAALDEVVAMAAGICVDDFGASDFSYASDETERRRLWNARHGLYHAAIRSREGAYSAITTDACVPLSKFAGVIDETAKDVAKMGVVGPCFGHAGDGNLHCILPVRHDDTEEYMNKLEWINERLVERTLAVGGTCTGEHGVGYGKIKFLERQYGPGAVHMMRLIKRALDPHNIMNPGKVILLD